MTLDKLRSLDKDDFLAMVGLETRRSVMTQVMPAVALFGVGILIGTGLGLLVAPRAGRELRDDLAHRLGQAPHAIAQLPKQANDALHRATDRAEGDNHGTKAST